MPHDSLLPPLPLPPLDQIAPQASSYLLHDQSEVVPPIVVHTTVLEDTHACMDRIKQHIRQLRVSDSLVVWDDLDSILVVSLLAKLRMPNIEKDTGVGYSRIHFRLYNTVIRAHGFGRVIYDHHVPFIFEWHDPKLVHIFRVIAIQDMG